MVLDKIQGLNLGFNPFVKPKGANDPSSTASEKTGGIDSLRARRLGQLQKSENEEKKDSKTLGLSFLKDGALGEDDALYVKGGRAGGLQNLIA